MTAEEWADRRTAWLDRRQSEVEAEIERRLAERRQLPLPPTGGENGVAA